MPSKSKDGLSSRNSSVGDELPKTKSEPARVSIKGSQDEQCEGLQSLRVLQNYVAAKGKGAAPDDRQVPDDKPGLTPAESNVSTQQALEPETSKSTTDVPQGKKLKRKPKKSKINPFMDGAPHPDHPLLPIPRPPKTVEIRGGDVLGQCECLKRNGLQQDCPKWDCRGESLCLTWPMPTCQPSGLGMPIVVESRVMRPDEPICELTTEEKKRAEKAAALEKRKEEVRLIEDARANWKLGKDQAAVQKAANEKKGYLKCNIHSGKYRLVPLMKNEVTQTPDAMYVCPCEEPGHLPPTSGDTKPPPQPEQSPGEGKEMSFPQAPATNTEKVRMESVRTSTTGIPPVRQLKALMKK